MNITVSGSFTKGRKKMIESRKQQVSLKNSLEKELKEKQRKNEFPDNLKAAISKIDNAIRIYSVSKTQRVELEGIVINYKLLQNFLDKLSNFDINLTAAENALVLSYSKPFSSNKGKLTLYDLSSYFEDFTDIPKVVITND